MSNLTLVTGQWHENINQVEKVEPILGGSSGNANLATKQLAENILWLRQNMQAHKVGDVYTTTLDHANAAAVAAHHGYGTWERYAEGRTLVGLSTKADDPSDYKTIGNEFGANTHKLTVDEMPNHKHGFVVAHETGDGARPDNTGHIAVNGAGATYATHNSSEADGSIMTQTGTGNSMKSEGGDQAHNNIQPSKVVARWLRTA